MNHRTLPLALALVLGLGACTTMTDTQRNTGLGALGGAVGGALIGKATGSDKVGFWIGEGTTAAAREISIGILTGVVGADADHASGSGRDCEGSLRTWKIEGCAWV